MDKVSTARFAELNLIGQNVFLGFQLLPRR